jgi:branched-chain amino acid transport system substrate-binding protein
MRHFNFLKYVIACAVIIAMVTPFTVVAQDGGEDAEDVRIGFWEECPTPENLSGEIPVGVIFGQSGTIAQYGNPQTNGVELALAEINDSGYLGDAEIDFIIEDGFDTDSAVAAMTKLVEQDAVAAVIGPTLSTQAFAADPIAAGAGIPVMGVSNTASGITTMTEDDDVNQFIFRNSLPESNVIPGTIASAVETLGIERVAILYGDDDDFTFSGYEVFLESLLDEGVEILSEETFSQGDVDFLAQLTNIVNNDPDAIVVSALITEAIQIVAQARELGYDGPIIGGNGFNSPSLIVDAGEASEGVIVGAAWNIINDTPLNTAFIESYTENYENAPGQFAAQAYTGAWLMATAIRCADSADSADIRAALAGIEGFDSPLGTFAFDEDRNPVHPPVVQIVDGGEFAIFDDSYADFYE